MPLGLKLGDMRFEHLLQVTDPGNPHMPPMSRSELWRGLLLRVESPDRFPLGPDRCHVRPGASVDERERSIHYGALHFEDVVKLEPEHRVVFKPEPHEGAVPVGLAITIEEPTPGGLFLRFIYEAPPLSPEEKPLQGYREQAWLENDREMLRTLREWQHEGRL